MVSIAILPSNQHLNPATGLPGVTEEKWAVAVCDWVCKRLEDRLASACIFHVPGKGTASTDELSQMIDEAIAWKPDYIISVHSDAVGDSKQTGILMLMAREADRKSGQELGQAIAAKVGLPYKSTWVYGQEARKIMYLKALRDYELPGCLVEVGEHATKAEAEWNWEHTKEIGLGIADALADYLGLEGVDMTGEQTEKLITSAQAQSYRSSITNALLVQDYTAAERLNKAFYERWPEGETGLTEGWAAPKA